MRSSVNSPIILDIEASGFGATSYPIEVGVAMDNDTRFCRLIRPQTDWQHWSEEAQGLHGISRSMLLEKVHQCNKCVLNSINSYLEELHIPTAGWWTAHGYHAYMKVQVCAWLLS